jgi:hypothetical protein
MIRPKSEEVKDKCHRGKFTCEFCGAIAHKAVRSRNNYALCDKNQIKHDYFVVRNWENVGCYKCKSLKVKK